MKKANMDVSEYIDTRHVISSAISMLRGDTDTDDKIASLNERRRDKRDKRKKQVSDARDDNCRIKTEIG